MVKAILKSSLMAELVKRPKDSHKGNFGHVLVIGGNLGCSGAARMAAEAALITGAGSVTVATHPLYASTLNIGRPELMVHGIEQAQALKILLSKATVVIVGPGLGQDAWAQALFNVALTATCPLVVDADALSLLAKTPQQRSHWILTPHPGEAARLMGETVLHDRIKTITHIQQRYQGVCVLKGAGTLVSDGNNLYKCERGNPGMASAGMGDVLTGVIAGLLAQGLSLMSAAQLGVELHAQAGDDLSEFGERGMLATDLFFYIHQALNCP